MKKELPINTTPFIRALPQYAYLDSIINNDKTNLDRLMSLKIIEPKWCEWDFELKEADLKFENNIIHFFRRKHGAVLPGGAYRLVRKEEEFVFNLQYLQYTNRWDGVVFFLDWGKQFVFSDELKWRYKFTIHCCGNLCIEVNDKMKFYQKNIENQALIEWYKIKVGQNKIEVFISPDGLQWKLLHQEQIQELGSNNKMISGFYCKLSDNQYYKWLCNNFIQIKYEPESGNIGYMGLLNRDYKNHAIHPFIKFSYDKKNMILHWGLWNYIMVNINSARYLEIWMDEYYIEGTEAYQRQSHIHESLIYGYNDETETVRLLTIYRGKPKSIEVSVEMISMAWQKATENGAIIKTFEFSPDERGFYELDTKHIYEQLCDYLSGWNVSLDNKYIAEKEDGVFGIDIYNAILASDESKENFLDDKREAYFLKEHKECMCLRIEYLYEAGVLSAGEYHDLRTPVLEILNISKIILNLVLKNQIIDELFLQERIWRYLQILEENERKCYSTLISILCKKLDAV